MAASTITEEPITSASTQEANPVLGREDEVVMDGPATNPRVRLLIEEWLPIAALGEESVRERRSMTALPPTYYLHVWWARRPLVASRAAILASLLPSTADRDQFLHMLGIHGDPTATRQKIDQARHTGEDLGADVYGYRRAFTYLPETDEVAWLAQRAARAGFKDAVMLDPMAGGGSIPFEARRLGINTVANDLNPVAWLVLKATVDLPQRFGPKLVERYRELAERFKELAEPRFQGIFPAEPAGVTVDGYLWARTIKCPYCGGKVPLSPNWKLDGKGKGVRLIQHTEDSEHRHCTFEVVDAAKDHSPSTVKGGDATCPFGDCGRVIDGDEIKSQAQAGQMGQQLFAVVFKQEVVTGHTKSTPPRPKTKSIRGFRAPRPEDEVEPHVLAALDEKMPEWTARDIIPTEEVLPGQKTDEPRRVGVLRWRDMFAPRQLFGHCTSVEVFKDLVEELTDLNKGELAEIDIAALTYLVLALDKMADWNSRGCTWHPNREVVGHTFQRHDFALKWSFAEMDPAVTGQGYDWVIRQTSKALEELVELTGADAPQGTLLFPSQTSEVGSFRLLNESADALPLDAGSVDCIVVDPPYYDNVMYAELSDFFYVWLKRTAGLLYPEMLAKFPDLTDKDREAVANPAHFRGQKGAKELACRDYEDRMARVFERCRSVLKPTGVMTVMFTHKSSAAWDALASGIVRAGFVITASWPVQSEAESSLHIKDKASAKSTIFLVCRPRELPTEDTPQAYWENVEPKVIEKVRERVVEFQAAGIGGVDLYLACFGPALQVFSEYWPLKRGRPVQQTASSNGRGRRKATQAAADPYAVRPEDALDAARREVKRWRLEQLATVKRQHHLDATTEWYTLAWETFKAPRFSADEALRLARVIGLDFDRDLKNNVCEVKGEDVTLWDSLTRRTRGKLGPFGGCTLCTLQHAALAGREQNTGVAQAMIQDAGLADDPTLLTALEVMLNVLPPPAAARRAKKADAFLGGAANDFEALEKLRQLAFSEKVPQPVQRELDFGPAPEGDADGEEEGDE